MIQDLSFSVADGEFLTIVGPSGAGKSTLLNIIAQIDTASAGEIVFDGTAGHDARPARAAAGLRPPHRLCDAGRQPAALAQHARQRAVRARGAGPAQRRDARACRDADPRGRACRLRTLLSARTLRRHAQAHGADPHAGLRSAGDPDGRAVRRRRRADPHAAPGRPAQPVGASDARPSSSSPTTSPRRSRSATARWCSAGSPRASPPSTRSRSRARAT